MSEIIVPAAPCYHLLEVKRSKFHCHIERAEHPAAAQQLIARLRAEYPEANHVCSAFIAGTPGNTTDIGCSDDGEPSGTAGKPMLNVLMHGDVSFVVAAVARIFGGTKLGTGGLARAYGGAVSEGMALLETEVQRLLTDARFSLPYAFEAQMRHLLQKHQGELQAVQYAEHVEASIQIEQAKLEDFTTDLRNACGGKSEKIKLD